MTDYKCCICHEKIKNKDTIRLCKQLYGISRFGGHYTVDKFDFCKKCYSKFENWLKKYEREK